MTTSSRARPTLTSGTIVHGHYRILDIIGSSSGHSTTCLVVDEVAAEAAGGLMEATRIALLYTAPEGADGDQRLEALRAAVETLRSHPHVTRAPILEAFDDAQRFWVVMATARGTALATLIETRALAARRDNWRRKVALNLADALVSLHDLGQVHAVASLEPGVINVDAQGRVTLTDFGLALFLHGAPSRAGLDQSLEVMAIRQFGRLMYAILTGERCPPAVEPPTVPPGGMFGLVMRCLQASGAGARPILAGLQADLLQFGEDDFRLTAPLAVQPADVSPLRLESQPSTLHDSAQPPSAGPGSGRSDGVERVVAPSPTTKSSAPEADAPDPSVADLAPPVVRVPAPAQSPSPRPQELTQLNVGDQICGRYAVIGTLEAPTKWGAVYRVHAVGVANELVAKQIRVPPLRQGLEARFERLDRAIEEWRGSPHVSRTAIVEVFRDDDSFWVVYEPVRGLDVEAFIAKKKVSSSVTWRATIASSLAQALESMISVPAGQLYLESLSPRHVMIAADGSVTLVNLGLSAYLKPVPPPESGPPDLTSRALKKYGELMYSILTGDAYGHVIVQAALPEDLSEVVMRTLNRSRADAYPSFKSLNDDLALFTRLAASESAATASWDDVDLEPVKPIRWRQRYLPPFLYNFTEAIRQYGEENPRVIAGFYLAVVVVAVTCWVAMVLHARLSLPTVLRVAGPVIFVMEDDGNVEVVNVTDKVSSGVLDLGGAVEGSVVSNARRQAYFTAPSDQLIASFDPATGVLDRRRYQKTAPLRQLYKVPGNMALGAVSDTDLAQLDLRDLQIRPNLIHLPQRPYEMIYVSEPNAFAFTNEQDIVSLYSPVKKALLATHKLKTPCRHLRLDNDGENIWVVSTDVTGAIPILDASTLKEKRVVEMKEPVMDVAFTNSTTIYVLLASGNVVPLKLPNLEPEKPLTGVRGSQRILSLSLNELWFLGTASELNVLYLDSGIVRTVPLRAQPRDLLGLP